MIADDIALGGLVGRPVRRNAVAELKLTAVAVGQLALARIDLRDGRLVHEDQVEREVVAVPHRLGDRASGMVLAVGCRNGLTGVVVRDGLHQETVDRPFGKHLVSRTVDRHHLVGSETLAFQVHLDAEIVLHASASRVRSDGEIAVRSPFRRVEREVICEEHGRRFRSRMRASLPPSAWMRPSGKFTTRDTCAAETALITGLAYLLLLE
jgi:hypothetical protein